MAIYIFFAYSEVFSIPCSKCFFSYNIYLVIMYIFHTIWSLCIIYNFDLFFKRTLTLFLFIKAQFIKLVHLIFMDLIINFLVWFIFKTWFLFPIYCRMISSTAFWTIALFSCFCPNPPPPFYRFFFLFNNQFRISSADIFGKIYPLRLFLSSL